MRTMIVCLLAALTFGLSMGAAQAQTTLISTGAVWKYLSDGSDQGTAWRDSVFDDTVWPAGATQIGFGDGDEATNIGTNRLIVTYYFRHQFEVNDAASITNLLLRLKRDDGAVVYLNGSEVLRSNMPPDEITYQTFALLAAPDDGTNFFPSAIDPALLVDGLNVLAVEIHQNGTNSSDMSFDLGLIANLPAQRPLVAITAPTNGATFLTPVNITINATASDSDGSVTVVEFFEGTTKLGEDTTAPYTFAWNGVLPGSYTLRAVAADDSTLSTTSAPVTITVQNGGTAVVPPGATWRYLDNGTDQGTVWQAALFDDSNWGSGPAELGYGDGDEATVVGFGGVTSNKFITTYFRHVFHVEEPSAFSSLVLRMVRDDGAIVYLNEMEIFRSNMPTGAVDYLTRAPRTISGAEEDAFFNTLVDPGLLIFGPNVLAVEIHQDTTNSSDISFNLELVANAPPSAPTVVITAPTNGATLVAGANVTINATAYDRDGLIELVEFFDGATKIGEDATFPYSIVLNNPAQGTHTLTARATDNGATMITSAAITITILPPPVFTTLIQSNAVWKYLDDGSDQGVAWRLLTYDDGFWLEGAAELGYGDGDEVTIVQSNRLDGSKIMTTYFRKTFNVPGPTAYTNLVVRLRRDDGGIVYINDVEVFRSNMPTGAVHYLTLSGGTIGSETTFFAANVNPNVLQSGNNVIAVEIHQSGTNSTDVSFNLQLQGVSPPLVGPVLRIALADQDVVLTWDETNVVLEQSSSVAGTWSEIAGAASGFRARANQPTRFYRLREVP
jgi:hypothetical protein